MSRSSFTLADVLVACFLAVLLLGLSQAMIGCGDGDDNAEKKGGSASNGNGNGDNDRGGPSVTSRHQQLQNSTQVKGIHNGLILFSQGNNDKYPGLKPDGAEQRATVTRDGHYLSTADGFHPQLRYAILLNGGFFTPDFAVAPNDDRAPAKLGQEVTPANFSYAMMIINEESATRNNDWANTTNSQAPVMSDRNLGGAGSDATSIHDPRQPWMGSVAWNDNHVDFETNNVIEGIKFTAGPELAADDLFVAGDSKLAGSGQSAGAAKAFDAAMCFAEPDDLTNQN